jgi:hypothetical protein
MCKKLHRGENGFDDALYCCIKVRQVWACGKCDKVHKTKNSRVSAQNCCPEMCCLCEIRFPETGKSACRVCIGSVSKHQAQKARAA